MTLKIRLLAGCLSFVALLGAVGGFAAYTQAETGALSTRIYDDGLVPLEGLRSVQDDLSTLRLALVRDGTGQSSDSAQLTSIQFQALSTASKAIDSAIGAILTSSLPTDVLVQVKRVEVAMDRLVATQGSATVRKVNSDLETADKQLETAVEAARRNAEELRVLIQSSSREVTLIFAGCLAFALSLAGLITLLLPRSILGPLRSAHDVVRSIAAGNLRNDISVQGSSEFAQLMTAIDTMQASVGGTFEGMETEMARIGETHRRDMANQVARFDAALGNMSQALCLLDKDGRIVVYNRRFEEIFGSRPIGQSSSVSMTDPLLRPMFDLNPGATKDVVVDDRYISYTKRNVVGGLGGSVVTMDDVTEKRAKDDLVLHMADHDELTGLANRRRFMSELGVRAQSAAATLLCLDLDGFKQVNDMHGHPVGDRLLVAVARRLEECVREEDFVARLGGDEFAVIVGGGRDSAAEIAKRIVSRISSGFVVDEAPLVIGTCIGIETADGKVDGPELVRRADLALYAAKEAGRNCVRSFQKAMSDRLDNRVALENDLRIAVERGELEMFYQQFRDVEGGRISGFEALIRWRHPDRGMVSPAEFIPIAEETGLIHPIGLWALREACVEARNWPDDVALSVNLSPIQFQDAGLPGKVQRIITETGLQGHRLQLEVTESLLLKDSDRTLGMLTALRRLGIRMSMDDFGTGYSSLAYLTRFPFDKVKIDQSFVRDMDRPQQLAIVRAVIGLSRTLGLEVIAEGVETERHRDLLLQEGCREMQGWLFGKAVPASELPGILAATAAASEAGAKLAVAA